MKLKISHRFWLNQYYSISLIIGLGIFSPKAFSQNKQEIPGLFESLEKLQTLNKDLREKQKVESAKTIFSKEDLREAIEIRLDPLFLKNILFNSDSKYLSLIKNDECKFYSLLENNLLKTSDDEILNIDIQISTKEGTKKNGTILFNDFFDEFYRKKCLNNKEFSILFNSTNYAKTISGIKFSIPKGENNCNEIHSEWLLNSYTPFLCKINQTLKSYKEFESRPDIKIDPITKKLGEDYIKKISLLQRNYIDSLCSNLNSSANFCQNYLKMDVWNKVLNGEAPGFKLDYKCANYLSKPLPITSKDEKICADKFISDPNICVTQTNKEHPAYFPLSDCNTTSNSLAHSKLISNYHDCPGNIDNEAITNVHRIINHFNPRKINSAPEHCIGEANYSFARLNLDIKNEKGWPLKVCYFNRIENQEKCTTYIPGAREDEPLSEDKVIAKILYLNKGAPNKTTCSIVSSKKYNPVRTDYKNGCFIVFNPETCNTMSCEKKVYWEDKEQKDIRFIGKPIFEYYATEYSIERYSIANLLNEVQKIQSRAIRNLTDLKFYLDKIQNSIIHGVGCAEDIIPEIYTRQSINQCHPLPFIISGYTTIKGETFLSTQTAIDDIFSPRLITWPSIYNGVSTFKELHPLNTWTLHGLKK